MRIAMLISGGGTTAAAIVAACRDGRLPGVEPACVIASSAEAPGLARLTAAGIPQSDILVVDPKNFAGSGAAAKFGEAIMQACRGRDVDFVGQYGWMCLTPRNVIETYEGR